MFWTKLLEMTANFCPINCFTAHRCSHAATAWNNSEPADRSQGTGMPRLRDKHQCDVRQHDTRATDITDINKPWTTQTPWVSPVHLYDSRDGVRRRPAGDQPRTYTGACRRVFLGGLHAVLRSGSRLHSMAQRLTDWQRRSDVALAIQAREPTALKYRSDSINFVDSNTD